MRRVGIKWRKYTDYNNNERIMQKLTGLSPAQYRTQTSHFVASSKRKL
ncbi:IS3 family transposase [Lysinibacillus sp. ZYM-1]